VAIGLDNVPRAWEINKFLLLPASSNLPIGFTMVMDNLYPHETFIIHLATHHGQPLTKHVNSWLQSPWCDS